MLLNEIEIIKSEANNGHINNLHRFIQARPINKSEDSAYDLKKQVKKIMQCKKRVSEKNMPDIMNRILLS